MPKRIRAKYRLEVRVTLDGKIEVGDNATVHETWASGIKKPHSFKPRFTFDTWDEFKVWLHSEDDEAYLENAIYNHIGYVHFDPEFKEQP